MNLRRHTLFSFMAALLFAATLIAQQPQDAPPQGAPPAEGGGGGRGRAGRGGGQGGSTQDVVGGVNTGQGQGQGGGGGRNAGPPPGPAPRNADGRALLGGANTKDKGVWLPVFGITDPIKPAKDVPFQPWAKAVYDDRQKNELEPHTRCKPSGVA